MSDPYITRRTTGPTGRKYHRATFSSHKRNPKDNPTTSRALDEINREYQAKEAAIASACGPHSSPRERHYEQEVKALPWPPPEETWEDE